MIRNYVKTAVRNLLKHKGHATINTFGLALGMAGCMLVYLFVDHELSYDEFHEQKDLIYSLYIQETKPDGSVRNRRLIPLGVPEAIAKQFPAVKKVVQLAAGSTTILRGGEPFRQDLIETDASFFDVFSFPLLAGDSKTALSEPSKVVISRDLAEKYFDTESARDLTRLIGLPLAIETRDGFRDFYISGVMENCPINSSLQIEMLIPFANYAVLPLGSNDVDGRTSTYFLLDAGQDASALEEALLPFTAVQFKNRIAAQSSQGQIADEPGALRLRLQPLSRLHHNPNIPTNYESPPYHPLYSYVLSGIGVVVFLIAGINFTTLSLARATGRAREVGMRKAVGAQKSQLVAQFWSEALLMSLGAGLLGLVIARLALPTFNNLAGKSLTFESLTGDPWIPVLLLGFIVLVGIGTGSYPALVLSKFHAARVLKGEIGSGGSAALLRILVGLQFTATLVLLFCATVMVEQVDFLRSKKLGFNDDMIVVFRSRQGGQASIVEKYRNALSGHRQVKQVVGAGQAFSRSEDTRLWQDASGATRIAFVYGVDYDYLDLFEIETVSGRNFSRSFATDPTKTILVNEALVRQFELKDAVGSTLPSFMPQLFDEDPRIIGVVKDFHFKSLHQEIKPAVLTMHPGYWARYRNVFVKIRPDDVPSTLRLLRNTWHEVAPNSPFNYFFLDEDIRKQYQAEESWQQIAKYATLLALAISCMGLFALSALIIGRRTKEIGIRKVLGASVYTLVVLVAKDFAKLSLMAFAVAWPLGYAIMDRWLAGFAYRIEVGADTILFIMAIAFSSVILTVSYQSIRASLANPADTLYYE